MLILTYDIQDNRLRTKFSNFVLQYGERLQYSVYEIRNSPRILELVKCGIKEKFERKFGQGDSVIIFNIKETSEILRFGNAKNAETDLLIY